MPNQTEEMPLSGEGVERKKIKAVDDALDTLVNAREKRMSWADKEADASVALVALFHKHELTVYRGADEKLYKLAVLEKVKRQKEPKDQEVD